LIDELSKQGLYNSASIGTSYKSSV